VAGRACPRDAALALECRIGPPLADGATGSRANLLSQAGTFLLGGWPDVPAQLPCRCPAANRLVGSLTTQLRSGSCASRQGQPLRGPAAADPHPGLAWPPRRRPGDQPLVWNQAAKGRLDRSAELAGCPVHGAWKPPAPCPSRPTKNSRNPLHAPAAHL